MKKPTIFGRAILSLGVLTLSLGTVSCKNEPKAEDPKEVAEDENEAKFDNTKEAEKDAEILVDAAEFDLEQRELGKLAQSRGVSAAVKDLGKMMEKHHNDAFAQLSTLAKEKQISIPTAITEDGQKEYDRLSKVDVKNFDKEYLDHVYKEHHDAIDDFTQDAQATKSVEIKAYLESMISTLKNHHDEVEKLQSTIVKK
jgi:putative membrane protein